VTARTLAFAGAAAAFALVIAWGIAGLPDFGGYPGPLGDVINKAAPAERHAVSAPVAVVMDYRGFDTLGEEFIIFTAAAAIVLLSATSWSAASSRSSTRSGTRSFGRSRSSRSRRSRCSGSTSRSTATSAPAAASRVAS